MFFNNIECQNINPLIQNFYEFQVKAEDVPLTSSIVPTAQCHIVNIDSKLPVEVNIENNLYQNNGTIVAGQSYKSFKVKANASCYCFGIALHPTALFKLFGKDLSNITDKHLSLCHISSELHNTIHSLFKAKYDASSLAKILEKKILNLPISEDKNTKHVDNAISLIYKTEGIITVEKLLTHIPISQKHLQTQFKKIVGLTPIKFIKLYKFYNLMKKIESKSDTITNLINYYEYYDLSHFTKDFRLFMNEQPKNYFDKEQELTQKYLKN